MSNQTKTSKWLGEWVRQARRHWGKSQEALGEALSVTKGNVSAWENGRHAPSYQQILEISRITGYPTRDTTDIAAGSIEPPKQRESSIPILYAASAKANGLLDKIPGSEISTDPAHFERQSINFAGTDNKACAIRIRGDGLADRILSGDTIVMEPSQEVQPGDIVYAELADGREFIRRLRYNRDSEVCLDALNRNSDPITLQASEITRLWKVTTIHTR